ncbi:antibiotic biosynthesis monooxygenase [Kushneria sp. AK178]
MTLGILATIDAKSGQEARVEAELTRVVAPSREDDGCLLYTLTRDSQRSSRFIMVEQWRDRAALDAHIATGHYKQMAQALENAVDGMEVREYDVLT